MIANVLARDKMYHTAANLSSATPEPGNEYELTICRAAQYLVDQGKGGAIYLTQWTSGKTLWEYYVSGTRNTVNVPHYSESD